jgi:hypothetical protein
LVDVAKGWEVYQSGGKVGQEKKMKYLWKDVDTSLGKFVSRYLCAKIANKVLACFRDLA